MNITNFVTMPSNTIDPETRNPSLHKSKWHKNSEHPICELCRTKFTWYNQKHHCRNCGRVICSTCQTTYYNIRGEIPILVCKLCLNCAINGEKDSDECTTYMDTNKLADIRDIELNFEGGKKARKSRKSKKVRKSRKSKKVRKSRKMRRRIRR